MPPNEWDTMLPSWNALPSPTTFIHNYRNQIILHINIDFHYKGMYNYHQLVSLLFSLLDWRSLNKNDDWCPFASRSRPMTGLLDTEITPAIKPTPKKIMVKMLTQFRLNGRDLSCVRTARTHLFRFIHWCE